MPDTSGIRIGTLIKFVLMIAAKYISLYVFGRCRLSDEYLYLHDQGNNLIRY